MISWVVRTTGYPLLEHRYLYKDARVGMPFAHLLTDDPEQAMRFGSEMAAYSAIWSFFHPMDQDIVEPVARVKAPGVRSYRLSDISTIARKIPPIIYDGPGVSPMCGPSPDLWDYIKRST